MEAQTPLIIQFGVFESLDTVKANHNTNRYPVAKKLESPNKDVPPKGEFGGTSWQLRSTTPHFLRTGEDSVAVYFTDRKPANHLQSFSSSSFR